MHSYPQIIAPLPGVIWVRLSPRKHQTSGLWSYSSKSVLLWLTLSPEILATVLSPLLALLLICHLASIWIRSSESTDSGKKCNWNHFLCSLSGMEQKCGRLSMLEILLTYERQSSFRTVYSLLEDERGKIHISPCLILIPKRTVFTDSPLTLWEDLIAGNCLCLSSWMDLLDCVGDSLDFKRLVRSQACSNSRGCWWRCLTSWLML